MKMTVITGYGYITDLKKNIIAKYDLPKGEHNLEDGYMYIEASNLFELNAIHVTPKEKTKDELLEEKIQSEIRKIAIKSLSGRGKL